MTLSTGPWWWAPVFALGWITTVPAQSFSAPARAAVIAAARFIPGVCGVLMSSSPACTTRTPCRRHFDSRGSLMEDLFRRLLRFHTAAGFRASPCWPLLQAEPPTLVTLRGILLLPWRRIFRQARRDPGSVDRHAVRPRARDRELAPGPAAEHRAAERASFAGPEAGQRHLYRPVGGEAAGRASEVRAGLAGPRRGQASLPDGELGIPAALFAPAFDVAHASAVCAVHGFQVRVGRCPCSGIGRPAIAGTHPLSRDRRRPAPGPRTCGLDRAVLPSSAHLTGHGLTGPRVEPGQRELDRALGRDGAPGPSGIGIPWARPRGRERPAARGQRDFGAALAVVDVDHAHAPRIDAVEAFRAVRNRWRRDGLFDRGFNAPCRPARSGRSVLSFLRRGRCRFPQGIVGRPELGQQLRLALRGVLFKPRLLRGCLVAFGTRERVPRGSQLGEDPRLLLSLVLCRLLLRSVGLRDWHALRTFRARVFLRDRRSLVAVEPVADGGDRGHAGDCRRAGRDPALAGRAPAHPRRSPRGLVDDREGTNRLRDVLERLLAESLEPQAGMLANLVVDASRDAYAARLGDALDPRGDVHAIAQQIRAVHDHVAQVDADAKPDF